MNKNDQKYTSTSEFFFISTYFERYHETQASNQKCCACKLFGNFDQYLFYDRWKIDFCKALQETTLIQMYKKKVKMMNYSVVVLIVYKLINIISWNKRLLRYIVIMHSHDFLGRILLNILVFIFIFLVTTQYKYIYWRHINSPVIQTFKESHFFHHIWTFCPSFMINTNLCNQHKFHQSCEQSQVILLFCAFRSQKKNLFVPLSHSH